MAHVIHLVAIMKELYPPFHLHIISFHSPRYTSGCYHEGAVSCHSLTHYFFSWPTLYPWSLSRRSCILTSTYTLFLLMAHVIHLVAFMKELYPAFHLHIVFVANVIPLVAVMKELYPAFRLHIISLYGPHYTIGRYHDEAVSCLPLTHYFFPWSTLYPLSLS